MRYRKLDEFYDMQGHKSGLSHYQGVDAVAAAVRSRILSFYKEWWEFPEEGLPMEALLGRLSVEKEQIADALIRVRILETENVLGITDYQVIVEDRKRVIYVKIETTFGTTEVGVGI